MAHFDSSWIINVASVSVCFNDSLKLLGVTLDISLSFDKPFTNFVQNCMFYTRVLHHIRLFLTIEAWNIQRRWNTAGLV